MMNIGQACKNAIDGIREGWTSRAASQYEYRGMGKKEGREAAEKLWRTADLDIEPEEAVDGAIESGRSV
jgi:hypothetical protein